MIQPEEAEEDNSEISEDIVTINKVDVNTIRQKWRSRVPYNIMWINFEN